MEYGALENWVVLLCKYVGMKCGLEPFRPTLYRNIQNKRRNHLQSRPVPFRRVIFSPHSELIKILISFDKVER